MIYFSVIKNFFAVEPVSDAVMTLSDMHAACSARDFFHLSLETITEMRAMACFVSTIDADYFVIKSQQGSYYSFVTAEISSKEQVSEVLIVHEHAELDEAILCVLSQLAIDREDKRLETYLRVKDGAFDE